MPHEVLLSVFLFLACPSHRGRCRKCILGRYKMLVNIGDNRKLTFRPMSQSLFVQLGWLNSGFGLGTNPCLPPYYYCYYYYFFFFLPGENPWWLKNYKRKLQNLFGSEHYSGRSSSTKPSCSKTELKRCTTTEIRWNKNEDARTSPVVSTNRQLPNSLKN